MGAIKSKDRIMLEEKDLVDAINKHPIPYLIAKFGVSKTLFYKVLSDQLSKLEIGLKPERPPVDEFGNSINPNHYKGAWMGSDIRKFMFDNNLLESQKNQDKEPWEY